MAIDTQGFRLLLAARKAGADFSRTLTFGRQNYFPKSRHVRSALAASGIDLDWESLPRDYCEPFFRALGATQVDSMDASPYENATIVHDLNQPVPAHLHGRCTAVFDGGTTEHVYHYPQAIENAVRLLALNGHFISITTGSNFSGHGFYQISPELFFRVFCRENGFETRAVLLTSATPGRPFFRVTDPATLQARVEFVTRDPYYIAVITKKIAAVDRLAVLPLQSDYAAAWKQRAAGEESKLNREFRRLVGQARGWLGRNVNFAWQNPGITRLSDRELYSL